MTESGGADGRREGVALGVLSRNAGASGKGLPPVLLVHGATFGSGLFDLPLPGSRYRDVRSGFTGGIRHGAFQISSGVRSNVTLELYMLLRVSIQTRLRPTGATFRSFRTSVR
mgnify:CR=1 FL=1